MQAEAIAKLQSEMDGNKNNHYIQVVGAFLLRHLEANPQDADKIMTADKSIAKSLDIMKEEARKKQSGGVAVLSDAEGFAIVLRYFGIESSPAAAAAPVTPPVVATPAPTSAASDFDVKLDDFL